MKLISRKMFFAAAALTLAAAAVGVILVDRDTDADMEKKLETAGEYLANSDYDNAIAIYNGIITEDDGCSEAYIGLAEAYYAKSRTEKSLEILERALEFSDDEDAIIEKIAEIFPKYNVENFWDGNDEYYANAEDESTSETENAFEKTEMTSVSEKITVTEATTVSETEKTTATSEVPAVTISETTTPVPVTTTTAPVVATTVTAAATTVPAATTTTAATAPEPQPVIVDDLTMMTVQEAKSWCSENNLFLSVIGDEGLIVSQSPAPGSVVLENSEIIVRCE